jgi:uncharacterized protein (UPF0218 family)
VGRSGPDFAPGVPLPEGLLLALPEGKRERLAAPFGDVFEASDLPKRLPPHAVCAVVGDVAAGGALRAGVEPRFIVVDYKTKRGPVAQDDAVRAFGARVEKVPCPAAHMTAALYNAVLRASRPGPTTRIEVDGEEDLAVMPAIMHLEPPASVIYGLPNRGATLVEVNGESRRVAREFLESFVVVLR